MGEVVRHLIHGGTEGQLFGSQILGRPVGHGVQVRRWIHHHHLADGDAGSRCLAFKKVASQCVPALQFRQFTVGPRMGDGPRQLGRQGKQKGHFKIREAPRLFPAHH